MLGVGLRVSGQVRHKEKKKSYYIEIHVEQSTPGVPVTSECVVTVLGAGLIGQALGASHSRTFRRAPCMVSCSAVTALNLYFLTRRPAFPLTLGPANNVTNSD